MHICKPPTWLLFRFKNKNWTCKKCSREYEYLGKEEMGAATVIKWGQIDMNSYIGVWHFNE